MNRLLFSALLWAACSTVFSQGKTPLEVTDPKITQPVNEAVAAIIADKKLAGAVTLVAQGGKIRHLQAHGEPVSTDTIFRIHSMTKAIVSAAALQQWEAGKYKLSDSVSKYIPAFSSHPTMTVEDLFRHTSGLPYNFTAPPKLAAAYSSSGLWDGDLTQFCDKLASFDLAHKPGESWTYGVGIDVLGHLVEIWSGKTLDVYLKEEIFEPLQMIDTGFWVPQEKKARFAKMYQKTRSGMIEGDDPLGQQYTEKPTLFSGGGGLTSTAMDYYQFLQMIADGGTRNGKTFLKPDTVRLMTTNQLPKGIEQIAFGAQQRVKIGFGLGFSVVTGKSTGWDEAAHLDEFGWGGAASCHYWVSPNDDNLIVITLEQTKPFNWNLERALKPLIYDVISAP